jgi:lipopolysaccharide heptosyltransferase II
MRILIVKIAAIGDVVMALPLLPHIRSQHPDAKITWICGKQVETLLKATGQIDRLIAVDEASLYKGSKLLRLKTMLGLWSQIAGHSYDLCLTCHPDPRYRWISFPIFCKDKRFLDRFHGRIHPVPGRYHADEYLRLFTGEDPSTISASFPQLQLSVKRALHEALRPDLPIVAISPGGAKNILADDALRRWPVESYAALARKLLSLPIQIALTGSVSDEWIKPYFADIPHIDLVGELNLLDFVAFLKRCSLFITHDSGPLHLAKLSQCPTIALFGPTMPSEKVGSNENISVIWGGEYLSCRPCYDGKTYARCKSNICLSSISPDRVFNEAAKILNSAFSFSC